MARLSVSDAHIPQILLYHRVAEWGADMGAESGVDNQYLTVHPEYFEEHLALLCAEYSVLPLPALMQAAQQGQSTHGSVALALVGGYAHTLHSVLPLLEKYACHATVCAAPDMLGSAHGWWFDLLEDLLLTGSAAAGQDKATSAVAGRAVAGCAASAQNAAGHVLPPAALPSALCLPELGMHLSLATPEDVLTAHEVLLDMCTKVSPRQRRLLLRAVMRAVNLDPARYTTPHPLLTPARWQALSTAPRVTLCASSLPPLCCHGLATPLCEATSARLPRESSPRPSCDLGPECASCAQGAPFVQCHVVRSWNGTEFRQWLHSPHKAAWEQALWAGRRGRLLRHVQASARFTVAPTRRQPVAAAQAPLRITHLNTLMGGGGAAGVMQLLQEVHTEAGHTARMLVGKVDQARAGGSVFDSAPDERLAARAQEQGLPDYHRQGSHALPLHALVRQANVLHVHNLHGGYFNPWSLPLLARQRPTLWTLHDMHALTGHCAHAFACTRWQGGCGSCPDLHVYPPIAVDSTQALWRHKQRQYACSPLHVVTPSQWLARCVQQSLLAEHPLTVIPNGIDTRVFTPRNKATLRARWGISPQALVVGGAAQGGPLHNAWKGGTFAMSAMQALCAQHDEVLFLGRGAQQEQHSQPHVRLLPYAHSEEDMADFYSMLDFLLYPSLADNCPLVVMEAMACGVPVLAFDLGGLPELVDETCGALVAPHDGEALCREALHWAAQPELRHALGQRARARAEQNFDASLMARRYERLYEEVCGAWRGLPQWRQCLDAAEIPAWVRTAAFTHRAKRCGLW